ncbi:MAG: DMT family transporter [Bacteroidetes bacterium]|nr:MAG: DMT family transporter [Bacteroidota bacterium]
MVKSDKLIQLHTIILLWGFTPVLGKLISFGALDLVWYRLALAIVSLMAFVWFKKQSLHLNPVQIIKLLVIGCIVGLHWYFFYHAIKVSNVSVAMAGFSTITLFASLLQPLLLKQRFFWGDFIYGIILVIGLGIIFKFETSQIAGLIYGILAALTGAFFGVYNGKLIQVHGAYKITFYEFSGALIFISMVKLFLSETGFELPALSISDGVYLLVLSVFCTTIAFTWSVEILKHFTPLTVIITNNLEPVYGIVFSLLLFADTEYMSNGFYAGVLIILTSVFTYPLIKAKFSSKSS